VLLKLGSYGMKLELYFNWWDRSVGYVSGITAERKICRRGPVDIENKKVRALFTRREFGHVINNRV